MPVKVSKSSLSSLIKLKPIFLYHNPYTQALIYFNNTVRHIVLLSNYVTKNSNLITIRVISFSSWLLWCFIIFFDNVGYFLIFHIAELHRNNNKISRWYGDICLRWSLIINFALLNSRSTILESLATCLSDLYLELQYITCLLMEV